MLIIKEKFNSKRLCSQMSFILEIIDADFKLVGAVISIDSSDLKLICSKLPYMYLSCICEHRLGHYSRVIVQHTHIDLHPER